MGGAKHEFKDMYSVNKLVITKRLQLLHMFETTLTSQQTESKTTGRKSRKVHFIFFLFFGHELESHMIENVKRTVQLRYLEGDSRRQNNLNSSVL
jgi:hypothetical protein